MLQRTVIRDGIPGGDLLFIPLPNYKPDDETDPRNNENGVNGLLFISFEPRPNFIVQWQLCDIRFHIQ